MSDRLQGSLQENILTLLVYSEKDIPLILNSVDLPLYGSSVFREIASAAKDYYRQFKTPIAEHLPDVLEHLLREDSKDSGLYKDVIQDLYWAKDSINSEYVISQLNAFIRKQNLKISVKESLEHLQREEIDEAEIALESWRKKRLNIFEEGTRISDPNKFLRFLVGGKKGFSTHINVLDQLDIKPAPGELYIFVALPRRGKTWFMTHIGKYACLNKKKVLHISLEMSEEKISMRYAQSFFSLSKRKASEMKIPLFEKDSHGRLVKIRFSDPTPNQLSLENNFIEKKLRNKLGKLKNTQLIIKEFPTRQLSMPKLRAYLDGLESLHNFSPNILLLDYGDLMEIDTSNLRIELGRVYAELRGLAQERNFAVVTASQANREAESAQLITGKYLAEDYSKLAIADNLITYTQTQLEKEANLARLYVEKSRNDRTGDTILISQNYSRGQFCLDSLMLSSNYMALLQNSMQERNDI